MVVQTFKNFHAWARDLSCDSELYVDLAVPVFIDGDAKGGGGDVLLNLGVEGVFSGGRVKGDEVGHLAGEAAYAV